VNTVQSEILKGTESTRARAADYNVEQAERGIIVLDEVDKIAAAKVSHGKDVGG
jgi:ATP-dependent protease Clp ATPase subunit